MSTDKISSISGKWNVNESFVIDSFVSEIEIAVYTDVKIYNWNIPGLNRNYVWRVTQINSA